MNLFKKSSFINNSLRSFSIYYSLHELRLTRFQYCLHNALFFVPRISNLKNFKGPGGSFVPERKFMDSYLGQTFKRKIVNAYDTVRYLGKTEERLLGFKWFKTLDAINYKEFISLLELADTFYSWFKIIELHTWMILLNLPQNTRAQRITRIGLIDAMWIDTERRADILAPKHKNFKKDMRALYQRFQVTLYLYDDAYFNSDRELSSAVWYNFFEKENVDPRLIEVLVSYIRYQVYHLNDFKLTPEKVEKENLKLWTPLTPHYEKIFKGY